MVYIGIPAIPNMSPIWQSYWDGRCFLLPVGPFVWQLLVSLFWLPHHLPKNLGSNPTMAISFETIKHWCVDTYKRILLKAAVELDNLNASSARSPNLGADSSKRRIF